MGKVEDHRPTWSHETVVRLQKPDNTTFDSGAPPVRHQPIPPNWNSTVERAEPLHYCKRRNARCGFADPSTGRQPVLVGYSPCRHFAAVPRPPPGQSPLTRRFTPERQSSHLICSPDRAPVYTPGMHEAFVENHHKGGIRMQRTFMAVVLTGAPWRGTKSGYYRCFATGFEVRDLHG